MTTEELYEKLKNEIEKEYAGVKMEMTTVTKNNEVTKTGAIIKDEKYGIAPVFYLEGPLMMINAGIQEADEVISEMKKFYKNTLSFVESCGDVYDHIAPENFIAVAINYDKNKEALEGMPHYRIEDMAIAIRNLMPDSGSVVVTNDLISMLDITEEEALNYAIENTKEEEYVITNLLDIMLAEYDLEDLKQMRPEYFVDGKSKVNMYVVTNKSGYFGAAGIYVNEDLRQKVREKIGGDYYILPSSVHEVVVVTADGCSKEKAQKMVEAANETIDDQEIFLSDNALLAGSMQ